MPVDKKVYPHLQSVVDRFMCCAKSKPSGVAAGKIYERGFFVSQRASHVFVKRRNARLEEQLYPEDQLLLTACNKTSLFLSQPHIVRQIIHCLLQGPHQFHFHPVRLIQPYWMLCD